MLNEKPKRKQRKRKPVDKHKKFFAINQPHLYQDLSQTSFSNSALKSRTIKKMEKSLPQSPQKKKRSNV